MKWFYQFFPRQVAFPVSPFRLTQTTEHDFYNCINQNNQIKPKVFASLYNCDGSGQFNNALIDKIGFDFDGNKYGKDNNLLLEKLEEVHNNLLELDYKHIFKFSTGGFWLYVFTKNYLSVKHHKSCLKNSQRKLASLLNLKIGAPEDITADIDFHVLGYTAIVSRVWNSYDTERKLFAIPVNLEDIKKGLDYIKEKAKNQNFEFTIYGTNEFDISKYDYEEQNIILDMPENLTEDYTFAEGTIIENFPPCVKRAIVSGSWKGWWLSVLYMKEVEGYTPKLIDKIMKHYLEKTCKETHKAWGNDYNHYKKHDNFPECVFKKDTDFPRCSVIYQSVWNQNNDGTKRLCKGKCKYFNTFYKNSKELDIPLEVV